MKLSIAVFIVTVAGIFSLSTSEVCAQEKSARPIKRWVRVEGGGLTNDYIVEFLIPEPTSWRVEAHGNKE